jgi:HJR/Mrr/RecB family endonuclease
MLQKVVFDTFNLFSSIINGDTPTIRKSNDNTKLSRQQTIDRFQSINGFNVVIMSQLAAGLGLNVIGANHVIHYSRHWNPAKENQATDRAYRIGQEKDVFVYYPMAVAEEFESFDIILDKLLSRKKFLAESTLFPTEQAEVTPDDLFEGVFQTGQEAYIKPLTTEEINNLYPSLFEAYIATIFNKLEQTVYLTPLSNDKGADIVVLGIENKYLIQVKQSKSSISPSAVQEIVGAKAYYQNIYKTEFKTAIATNGHLTETAALLAKENDVKIFDTDFINKTQLNLKITISEVQNQESLRLVKI